MGIIELPSDCQGGIWVLFVIALDIRRKILKKIMLIATDNQRFWKELHQKKSLGNVIAFRKILKADDILLMSARWWTD